MTLLRLELEEEEWPFVIHPPPPSMEGKMCLIHIGYMQAVDWWPLPCLNLFPSKLNESAWSTGIVQESVWCIQLILIWCSQKVLLKYISSTTVSILKGGAILKITTHTSLCCCCSPGSSLWNSGGHGGQQGAQDEETDLPRAGLSVCSWLQRQDSRSNKPPALCHKGEATERAWGHSHLLRCGACGGGPS